MDMLFKRLREKEEEEEDGVVLVTSERMKRSLDYITSTCKNLQAMFTATFSVIYKYPSLPLLFDY